MANLTVDQPRFKVLKAEVSQNLLLDRSKNLSRSEYNIYDKPIHNMKTYVPKSGDNRHVLDFLEMDSHRPYLCAVTCLVESPMKLYVQNQNFTSILFGNDNDELVKNVVRFEANLRWYDFYNLLPVNNKKSIGDWKITDFNNCLNENPMFE